MKRATSVVSVTEHLPLRAFMNTANARRRSLRRRCANPQQGMSSLEVHGTEAIERNDEYR